MVLTSKDIMPYGYVKYCLDNKNIQFLDVKVLDNINI
jgi:hypothetical protein